MTGPEHYREAERLIALAEEHWMEPEGGDYEPTDDIEELETRAEIRESARVDATTWLAMAQVHATLALTAATATDPSSSINKLRKKGNAAEWAEWSNACAVPTPTQPEADFMVVFDETPAGGGSDA
jgi:hypothetical protein